jgi:hypothetical protein
MEGVAAFEAQGFDFLGEGDFHPAILAVLRPGCCGSQYIQ